MRFASTIFIRQSGRRELSPQTWGREWAWDDRIAFLFFRCSLAYPTKHSTGQRTLLRACGGSRLCLLSGDRHYDLLKFLRNTILLANRGKKHVRYRWGAHEFADKVPIQWGPCEKNRTRAKSGSALWRLSSPNGMKNQSSSACFH